MPFAHSGVARADRARGSHRRSIRATVPFARGTGVPRSATHTVSPDCLVGSPPPRPRREEIGPHGCAGRRQGHRGGRDRPRAVRGDDARRHGRRRPARRPAGRGPRALDRQREQGRAGARAPLGGAGPQVARGPGGPARPRRGRRRAARGLPTGRRRAPRLRPGRVPRPQRAPRLRPDDRLGTGRAERRAGGARPDLPVDGRRRRAHGGARRRPGDPDQPRRRLRRRRDAARRRRARGAGGARDVGARTGRRRRDRRRRGPPDGDALRHAGGRDVAQPAGPEPPRRRRAVLRALPLQRRRLGRGRAPSSRSSTPS